MKAKKEVERLEVSLTFTAEVISPFVADFKFDTFSLDVSYLQIEALKDIKSLTISFIDTAKRGNDNLKIVGKFIGSIRKDNKAYKGFMELRDGAGPLGADKIMVIYKAFGVLVIDLIKYIGWRKDLDIQYSQFEKIKIDWRWDTDGMSSDDPVDVTHRFSNFQHYYLTTDHKVHIAAEDFVDFYSLQDEFGAVPLHHELLFEVDRLRQGQYNRSAYLMLYTTLEVATKGLIRQKKPDAAWLINNMASPNLNKLYSEYINKEIAPILDSDDLDNLMKITTKRNSVAHTGEGVKKETLEKHFEQIKRWVKQIDFVLGYEWAKGKA
ncbi:hypothetical protein GCM10028808_74840 [Spirosoma migulaei]